MSSNINDKVIFSPNGEILLDGDPGKTGYMLVNNGGNTTPRWENIPFHTELQDSTFHFDNVFNNTPVSVSVGRTKLLEINVPSGYDHFAAFGHSAFAQLENQTAFPLPWYPTYDPPYPPLNSSPADFGGTEWGFKTETDSNGNPIQVPVTDLNEWITVNGAEPVWWGSTATRGTGQPSRCYLQLQIKPNGRPLSSVYQAIVFSQESNSLKGMQWSTSCFLDTNGGDGANISLYCYQPITENGNATALDYSLSVTAWKHPEPRR